MTLTLEMQELERTFEEAWDAAFEAEFAAGGFQEIQEAYQRFDRAGLVAVIDSLSVHLDRQGKSMAAAELRIILATSEEAAGRENGDSKEIFPPTHCVLTARAGYAPQQVAVNVANPVASDIARDSGSNTDPAAPSPAADPSPVCEWAFERFVWMTPSRHLSGEGRQYETTCGGFTLPPNTSAENCPQCGLPIKFKEAAQ